MRTSLNPRQAPYAHLVITSLALLIFSPFSSKTSQAQSMPPITPAGLNTHVSDATQGTQYDITGGTRPGGGTNLFHSFGEFNVPSDNIANFLNDSGLETTNILSRITGGNPSSIFGTIQTTGFGNANLFLMNPSGIVFGPNASLNVGGSVAFTTADYLRLTENGDTARIFHANPALQSVLTSAPVAAFGFLGSNPAAISIQGSTLAVQPGQSIALIGGNQGFTYTNVDTGNSASVPDGVTVTAGQLSAHGGKVNIASVASPGEIAVETLNYAPNITDQSFGALGEISVSGKSLLDASGKGGGTVLIRGSQFVLNNSMISANVTGPGTVSNGVESIGGGIDIAISQDAKIQNGAVIETNVSGNATPGVTYGGVHLRSDHIEIVGTRTFPDAVNGIPQSSFTGIRSNIYAGSTGGNSGAIRLESNSVLVKNEGQLETIAGKSDSELETVLRTAGHAGDILIVANQNLEADFSTIRSASSEGSTGDAGNIALTSTNGNIILDNSSQVTSQASFSRGNTGNISLNASQGNILLTKGTSVFNQSFRGGALGTIQVVANNLELGGGSPSGGSSIQGDNFSVMTPGDIILNLSGSLHLAGASRIQTVARVQTPAAALTIRAHDINVTGESYLSTESKGSGTGGTLNIFTDNLQLLSGGQIRSGSILGQDPVTGDPLVPTGPGGIVTIQGQAGPADSILIDGHESGIFTNTEGTGKGGTVRLLSQSLTLQNGGTISAETLGAAPSAAGGSIIVKATDHVTMTDGASITARSTGPADAGNISIDAGKQLDLEGKSSITTEATQAKGGNIKIKAVDLIRAENSEISTSVRGGAGSGGNITIDPKVVVLQNSQILAQAVSGKGGDITITTPMFLSDSLSRVDASTPFGLNGIVRIQSPYAPSSGRIQPLSNRPLQVASLLNQRCAALAGGEFSSFTVAGRDSLPTEPGGWLTSPLTRTISEPHPHGDAMTNTDSRVSPAESREKLPFVSLRRITPPGFLTKAFAAPSSAGCAS